MIIASRKDIVQALQAVYKAVPSNPITPLYGNILLEAIDTSLRLSATNFEIGIKRGIGLISGDTFETTVPAEVFTKLCNSIQDDNIAMELDAGNQRMEVITPISRNKINCMSAEEYPSIPEVENVWFPINSTQFKKMVQRVSFAAKRTDDGSGTVLTGVLLQVDPDAPTKFIMFATDGYHLSYEDCAIANENRFSMYAIVKASTLELISRLLDDGVDMQIFANEKQIRFRAGSTNLTAQLTDGKYPDPQRLLMATQYTGTHTTVVIGTTTLLRACKQLEVFAEQDKSYIILDFSGFLVEASIDTKQKGNSSISLPVKLAGSPLRIALNPYYLQEVLEVIESPSVTINMQDARSPVVFKMDGSDYVHFILPIAMPGGGQ